MGRHETELAGRLVEIVYGAGVGGRKIDRMCDDGLQHFPDIEAGADRLADLAQRPQPFQRPAQFVRPFRDVLFQGGVRGLELRRHVVELPGQRFELVAGPDVYP